jgi:hypothetical protein
VISQPEGNEMARIISAGELEQNDRIEDNLKGFDWANASLSDMEDLFEDRDPIEFL